MFRNSKFPIILDGAKIENLDFLEEILKNPLKVRKYAPKNVAILFNLVQYKLI
jgi:hypothetical protein